MIYLPEVAETLEKILNGVDTQVSGLTNPTGFEFKVWTAGFHIDTNYDKETKKNFIPVFVDSDGGGFDAVKDIKRQTIAVNVVMYYPVRFKNDFFAITSYLVDCFVAQQLNYGTLSGKCLSNIGGVRYGEIQGLDLVNFSKWVNENYQKTIAKMENYMSLQFTLYLTNIASGFILGNSVGYTLEFNVKQVSRLDLMITSGDPPLTLPYRRSSELDVYLADGYKYYGWTNSVVNYYTRSLYFTNDEPYYTIENGVATEVGDDGVGSGTKTEILAYSENLVWTSSGTGVSNSPMSQQLIDVDDYAKNTINITNYNKSIIAYIRSNNFWDTLLEYYNEQKLNELIYVKLSKTYSIGEATKSYTYNQLVLSLNENVALGEPLSFTITFGDLYEQLS